MKEERDVTFHFELHITRLIPFYYKIISSLRTKWVFFDPEFCDALRPLMSLYFSAQGYEAYKEMSKAVGMKKPQEAQKAKALWKMKAATEAGEQYFDTTREDNIRGRNETRLVLWEEHFEDPIVALDKALKWWKNRIGDLGLSDWWKGASQWRAFASSKVCRKSRFGRAFERQCVQRCVARHRVGSWQRWHQAVTWRWTCCARKCTRPGCCGGCQMSPVLKKEEGSE